MLKCVCVNLNTGCEWQTDAGYLFALLTYCHRLLYICLHSFIDLSARAHYFESEVKGV